MQQGLAEWPGEGSCVASDNNLRRFLCQNSSQRTEPKVDFSTCAIIRAVHESESGYMT